MKVVTILQSALSAGTDIKLNTSRLLYGTEVRRFTRAISSAFCFDAGLRSDAVGYTTPVLNSALPGVLYNGPASFNAGQAVSPVVGLKVIGNNTNRSPFDFYKSVVLSVIPIFSQLVIFILFCSVFCATNENGILSQNLQLEVVRQLGSAFASHIDSML